MNFEISIQTGTGKIYTKEHWFEYKQDALNFILHRIKEENRINKRQVKNHSVITIDAISYGETKSCMILDGRTLKHIAMYGHFMAAPRYIN